VSSEAITMQEIADKAGVARSTVSKALRNDPTISNKRRAEIQKIAKRLGYHPHPMVATLMAQLHRVRRLEDPQKIAWVDMWPESHSDSRISSILKPLLQGAGRRAAELGYEIDVHRPAVEHINLDRLRNILIARCQWGLIIPPVPDSAMNLALDLKDLTAVTIGTSLHQPVMHRVSPNHFQGGEVACRELRGKGFRRIGLIISPAHNERVNGKWLGAYLAQQQDWPQGDRLVPLIVDSSQSSLFFEWWRAEKPDAILIADQYVIPWLKAKIGIGWGRPRVAWLVLQAGDKKIWGVDYRATDLGSAAVDLLVGQIHLNARGAPSVPHTLLIDSVWSES